MEKNHFTYFKRNEIIQKLREETFDLVVIGGGITGAGILLDASSRGMKVALVEKGDFASGTSSKSSKLIHGGLRYLKQFELLLVKEVGTERAIVHKLAPHLVIPEKMLLPLIENGSYGEWMTSFGLKVYDILADVEGDDKRKMMDKEKTLALEPLLPEAILKGSGYYAEYRTDDARLTLENIKTGLNFGGTALNYTKVNDFLYTDGQISGVKVADVVSGEEYQIKSKFVINAAGPWVDELRTINHSKEGKQLHLTKGVHLVFEKEKLPLKQSVYFDIPDGRMMFAIPRGNVTYAGTTDTNYERSKDEVIATTEDADYLLNAINNMFPSVHLERKDIVSSWAGLRPLIHEEGKSPSELSRKDEIFSSDSGLLSMAGGKLTGYRKMAERVVDKLQRRLERQTNVAYKDVFTDEIPLVGGPWKNYKEVKKYIAKIHEILKVDNFKKHRAWYLVTTYGKQTEAILARYNASTNEKPKEKLILAELQFCIHNEMVVTPLDFFVRRTGRLYFDIKSVKKHREIVFSVFKETFDLNDATLQKYNSELDALIKSHSEF
ncbi:glycerol-3-phosphate dehydrogenase/oxidase [Cellulophaga baltica]|uniref:glycerol-3-phosphate dehydrogenase/oxidase n=1 Tax=Cellulophaga baltica TaxID=76594 RepID=UPI00041FE4B4|nr:glycerol-3-phosphate dehydrogenase/oxidase [Cellulophaga baltica]AIY12037.1 glycerol-3-phosphate dehydrogenase [Cellulophaga baltica NN016038]